LSKKQLTVKRPCHFLRRHGSMLLLFSLLLNWITLTRGFNPGPSESIQPPKLDRLDMAGGLNRSVPGSEKSTGNPSFQWDRVPQRYLLLPYALPNAYLVPAGRIVFLLFLLLRVACVSPKLRNIFQGLDLYFNHLKIDIHVIYLIYC
jgi:hypothetical protein